MATHASQYHRELPPPSHAQYQATQDQAAYYQPQAPRAAYQQTSHGPYEQPAQTSYQPNYQSTTTAEHQRQYSHQKPISKPRTFSFHSDKSHKSSHSKPDLYETSAQKEAKRLQSKADPTLAISEAEPAEIAAMTQSSLAPLRSIQHRDTLGNPIADPDKSNPTRSRWERPLDTIRSFEAAIDGGYSRRSMIRADTDSVTNWNRRSSYHPGLQSRYQESHHGSRPVSFRPDQSQFDYGGPSARNSLYEGNGQGPMSGLNGSQYQGYSNGPGRQRTRRMNSEPLYPHQPHGQNVYHLSHKDRSYETVTSAAGSGASDQLGYQTDPTSSDNSSIERNSPARKPVNDYGIGFSQQQAYHAPNFTVSQGRNGHHPLPPTPGGYPQGMQTVVSRKEVPGVLRRQPTAQKPTAAAPEKRKSWFSRRFSKN